ncbi:MAG TPA: 16S rRNA (cytidine(1402)-2'-O)-methyltransferase [Rhizomicrobium sp.]|jgi:16S rRNA (cytidine1402-2'-O)-methyltransferase
MKEHQSRKKTACEAVSEPNASRAESQKPLAPGLYLTATPIGNAGDVTLRALEVLRGCDAIAAEDTRVTSRLLAIYAISRPLLPYNDHNAAGTRPKLLARLRQGERIALVSDAGTPLVSDPGFKLVREAVSEGLSVWAIPGASAVLAALTLSGLPSDRFLFAGFLPPRAGERRTVLEELKPVRASLVFFESAPRLVDSLADMLTVLGPRPATIARELTKLHEEIRRSTLAELASHYAQAGPPRGEIVIVIGADTRAEPDFACADSLLDQALAFMPVRAASDLVAEALGLPRRALYARALARKDGALDD